MPLVPCNHCYCLDVRPYGPGPLPRHGLELWFADFAQMPTMRTISHALTALQEVRNAPSTEAYRQQIWPFWLQRDPRFLDRQQAEDRLGALVDSIPLPWRLAAIGVGGGAPLPIPSPPFWPCCPPS